MNYLNIPICASEFGNTGVGECIKEIKKIIGAIQVPKSFRITPEDLADLQAFFVQKTHAAIGARVFPYWGLVLTADNTEEPTIQTDAYGGKTLTRVGDYDLTYQMKTVGPDIYGNIEKNAGKGKYFLLVDEDYTIVGKKHEASLGGILIDEFIVPPSRFATGDAASLYTLRLLFGSAQLRKGGLGYVTVGDASIVDSIQGLQDVKVTLAAQEDNVLKIVLKTAAGGTNLYPAHSTQLAAAAAWVAREVESGDVIDITSVTADPTLDGGNGGFTVTLDAGDYGGLAPGDQFTINLAAPSVLAANPINLEGYEGIRLTIGVAGS